MTVKELIEQLQKLDPDIRVMTNGYEGGFQDAESFTERDVIEVVLNANTSWYYGPHEDVNDTYGVPDKSQYQIVKAIVI